MVAGGARRAIKKEREARRPSQPASSQGQKRERDHSSHDKQQHQAKKATILSPRYTAQYSVPQQHPCVVPVLVALCTTYKNKQK